MAISPGVGGVSRPLKEGASCLYSSEHLTSKRSLLDVFLSCLFDSKKGRFY